MTQDEINAAMVAAGITLGTNPSAGNVRFPNGRVGFVTLRKNGKFRIQEYGFNGYLTNTVRKDLAGAIKYVLTRTHRIGD